MLDRDMADRRGQPGKRDVGVPAGQQIVERFIARPGMDDAAPRAQQLVDRRKRPPDQEGGGEDRARRNLVVDRQPGAQPQGQRLQDQPDELADGDIMAARKACLGLKVEHRLAFDQMTPHQRAPHAKGADDLRPSQRLFLADIGLVRGFIGLLQRRVGLPFVAQRDEEEQAAAHHRHRRDRRMDQEADDDVDGAPGKIEDRQDRWPCQRLPQRVEFAQDLLVHRLAGRAAPTQGGVEQQAGKLPVEPDARPNQQAGSHLFEQRQRRDDEDDDDGQKE